jgi:hypothetical protein
MWSAPCPLLGNGSLNTFQQKQMHGTIGDLLLGNGAVITLCQQYRLFSLGSMQSGYKRPEFQNGTVMEAREWDLKEYKGVQWS